MMYSTVRLFSSNQKPQIGGLDKNIKPNTEPELKSHSWPPTSGQSDYCNSSCQELNRCQTRDEWMWRVSCGICMKLRVSQVTTEIVETLETLYRS